MKYALLVAWREFVESTKAKGFWLGIFLMPMMLFFSIQVPIWLEKKATPVRYFALVDQSGSFASVVESGLEKGYQKQILDALNEYARRNTDLAENSTKAAGLNVLREFTEDDPHAVEKFMTNGGKDYVLERLREHLKPGAAAFQEPRRLFRVVTLPSRINTDADLTQVSEQLKPYLLGEEKIEIDGEPAELSAAILIPREIEKQIVRPLTARVAGTSHPAASAARQVQYWSINAADSKLRDDVEWAINAEIRRREYLARGLDSVAIREVEQTYVPFARLNPKKEKGKEAVGTADMVKQWAPSGFVYLLWLAIFVIVQMLLNNTIEEKSNRIIEVLLSSVTPGELMMGKLFGIAAVGLTMVGAWMLALFGILSWKAGGATDIAGQMLTVLKTSNLVPLFSIYFLLGYLMYAAFILSIGSVCNTIKDAQSYMGVLTMVMMVPLLTMTYIPKDPNGSLARLLSWIPLYTPFTMMNRAGADPPLFDMIGTMVLLLSTTSVALWMTGKIFRIGVLRSGQPPKILEMIRWATRKES